MIVFLVNKIFDLLKNDTSYNCAGSTNKMSLIFTPSAQTIIRSRIDLCYLAKVMDKLQT